KAAAVYSNEHDQAFPMATVGGIAGPGGKFQGMPVASYVAKKAQNMGAGLSYRVGPLLVHGLFARVTLLGKGLSAAFVW
ncbi:porin, partial [Burkholderia pseudomallei]